MKSYLLALGLLGVVSTVAYSQRPPDFEILKRIHEEPNPVEAIEAVLEHADEYQSLTLIMAAGAAFAEHPLEDSAFLLYAGELRADFDRECFPPEGTGGNSPFLVHTALFQQYGSSINPVLMARPDVLNKVANRLKKWTPKAPNDYDPGYFFVERKSEQEALKATKPDRTRLISQMEGLATLLNDAEYSAALRVVRAYNSASEAQKPTKEAYNQAVETMRRIEKDKEIEGFISAMGDQLPPKSRVEDEELKPRVLNAE